ncbi:MAG: hypothetical protein EPN26_08120 [Rhodospirillales bacterium]|nr:MAG: hypothetical protein EPN26_08120 [Rhodospirillales bacterium]
MGKAVFAGLCAVVIGFSSFGAIAQEAPVPFKAPGEGTAFEFFRKDGTTITATVVKVDGQVVLLKSGNRFVSFGPIIGSTTTITEDEIKKFETIFPLQVGKKVSSSHTFIHPRVGALGQTDKIEVASSEDITVPAGTFKTWLIRTDTYGSDYSSVARCWYAPEISYCAKQDFEDSRGTKWANELSAVKAPTATSSSVREANDQDGEVQKVITFISGKSFKCENLRGRAAGDIAVLDLKGDGSLHQDTLFGPQGSGSSEGNWRVVAGKQTKGPVMVKEYDRWPGKWDMPIELIEQGFQMFTNKDGGKEVWKICKLR